MCDRASYHAVNWLYRNPRFVWALLLALILVAGQMDTVMP